AAFEGISGIAGEAPFLAGIGILDRRVLQRAVEVETAALDSELGQGRGERAPDEGLAAGADIARRVEPFRSRDAILQQRDMVVAELDLGKTIAEDRPLDGEQRFPGT